MEIKLLKHELMLLELLRAALNQDKANREQFDSCTSETWCECYKLAVQQGVMALAWDGVSTLPEERMPPRSLKLKWALVVERYEKRYRHYCHVIKQLSDFYALHGIATMQLKGVGFSSYYPIPEHREGGDIDIYSSFGFRIMPFLHNFSKPQAFPLFLELVVGYVQNRLRGLLR